MPFFANMLMFKKTSTNVKKPAKTTNAISKQFGTQQTTSNTSSRYSMQRIMNSSSSKGGGCKTCGS